MSPLTELLTGDRPFALIRRQDADAVDVYSGAVTTVATLADIPLDPHGPPGPRTLALVPYRQIAERGFAYVDDGAPLECLAIGTTGRVPLDTVLAALPDGPVRSRGDRGFDLPDEEYAEVVGRVLRDEIGRGEGANFVIHRVFEAHLDGDPRTAALAALRALLVGEKGAYWTFLVHTGARTLVGATPERHVSVEDGLVMMNPISGTFRHDGDGDLRGLPVGPEGDRRALHGARRGAEDDGDRRRPRRAGRRAVPQGDGPPDAHRVPAGRPRFPGRAGRAARDDVRPDGHRQPDRERLPGHRPARGPRPAATTPGCSRCSAPTTSAGRRWTRRS